MNDKKINGLEELVRAAREAGNAPVERWDPPYCGDIGLAIRPDGVWLYRGSPIQRPALVKLFSRILRRDPDGRTYLVTPAEKVDIAVADAPFLAVEMEVRGEGETQDILFRTNVDDIVAAGANHPLRFATEQASGGLKPYILVRGRLEALASRALAYDLIALAEAQTGAPSDRLGLWSGGRWFSLDGVDAILDATPDAT